MGLRVEQSRLPNLHLTYTGEVTSVNVPAGHGVAVFDDGSTYSGGWLAGAWSGAGVLVKADKSVYSGEFAENACNGAGVLVLADGTRFEGAFAGGVVHGAAIERLSTCDLHHSAPLLLMFGSGDRFEGVFCDGKRKTGVLVALSGKHKLFVYGDDGAHVLAMKSSEQHSTAHAFSIHYRRGGHCRVPRDVLQRFVPSRALAQMMECLHQRPPWRSPRPRLSRLAAMQVPSQHWASIVITSCSGAGGDHAADRGHVADRGAGWSARPPAPPKCTHATHALALKQCSGACCVGVAGVVVRARGRPAGRAAQLVKHPRSRVAHAAQDRCWTGEWSTWRRGWHRLRWASSRAALPAAAWTAPCWCKRRTRRWCSLVLVLLCRATAFLPKSSASTTPRPR